MTAHVFIVGEQTFPLHLRHQFAGIGARDHAHIDFNASAESKFTPQQAQTESNLVKMIADVARIRSGDKVIFYLQQSKGNEGMFYGVFRAEGAAFLDNAADGQFLLKELGKSLTFRVRIAPDEVYPQGVTEWHALDEIQHLNAPYQMLWSLIYRKLRALRGCTMITPYEEDSLCELIRVHNGRKTLPHKGRALGFDPHARTIIVSPDKSAPRAYAGGAEEFSMMPRLLAKHMGGYSFEAHLQAHIVATFGMPKDPLSKILLGQARAEWLGNEVPCGVGMQKIDLMVSFAGPDGVRQVMPIELKSVKASADNLRQIQRYVDWIRQYYIPNRQSIISPVLVAMADGALPCDFPERVRRFNRDNAGDICKPLRMVEFSVGEDGIRYQERNVS